mmetsp:Transcript_14981/g.19093  ORF Transcript_14981/g.19093 Transcript_14981/m.19093 type:complete len:407 (+) Transcript_14981:49-1269(+)
MLYLLKQTSNLQKTKLEKTSQFKHYPQHKSYNDSFPVLTLNHIHLTSSSSPCSSSRIAKVGGPVVSVLTVIVPPELPTLDPILVPMLVGLGVFTPTTRLGVGVGGVLSSSPTVTVTPTVISGVGTYESNLGNPVGKVTGTSMVGGKHSGLQAAGHASEAATSSEFNLPQSPLGFSATSSHVSPSWTPIQSGSLSQFTKHSLLQDAGHAVVADSPEPLTALLQRPIGSSATSAQLSPSVLSQASSLSQLVRHSVLQAAGQASEADVPSTLDAVTQRTLASPSATSSQLSPAALSQSPSLSQLGVEGVGTGGVGVSSSVPGVGGVGSGTDGFSPSPPRVGEGVLSPPPPPGVGGVGSTTGTPGQSTAQGVGGLVSGVAVGRLVSGAGGLTTAGGFTGVGSTIPGLPSG